MKELKRININVPLDTLSKIDEYASKMTITRTSAILVLVNQALDSQRALTSLDEIIKLCQKTEKAKIDDLTY